MITALAGGVGAAKFLSGLIKIVPEEELTVIVNTGDDIELFGLHISPDLDIVTYTLAGIVDEEKGWGIKGDTFHCLEMLRRYGYETWFNLGDRDLATHIHRTILLGSGLKLSEVTKDICRRLGLKVNILPMTDDRFETWIETNAGLMHFQEYLVKRGAKDRVLGVKYIGVESASPAEGVIESILESELIIICPSNPIVSIGTILSLRGVREALRKTQARKVAISPIVSGAPIKGPADKLMSGLGMEVSAFSVAYLYRDFLNIFVLDQLDVGEKDRIERLGIKAILTNTIMRTLEDKINLAKTVLEASQSI
ncbi:MAG: 2-phospho-L-lactate transferase [Candidatus Bathyarchaeia archaeon]